MAKEIIDLEVKNELDELAEEEKFKLTSEERVRNALWGFEILEQEKLINAETQVVDLMNIVRTRRTELRDTKTYAQEAVKGRAVDEVDDELHDVAVLEAEKAGKLWIYINATLIELDNLMLNGFQESTAGRIKEKLKEKLHEMEISDSVKKSARGGSASGGKKDWEKQL